MRLWQRSPGCWALNKDKLTLTAGFMSSLVLLILLCFEYAVGNGHIAAQLPVYGLTMAAAFLFPFIVLLVMGKGSEDMSYRFKPMRFRWMTFTVLMAIALTFMNFLLNWGIARIFSAEYSVQNTVAAGNAPLWQLLCITIVLPAVLEELFFRGALLPALEGSGFWSAMLVSALAFALVHGDLTNLAGPFICGLVYAYMTYITGSVWSAVLAHLINNGLTFVIGYMLEKYAAVGLWEYFLLAVVILFFIFLYFAMGRLERLVEKGKVPRIKRSSFVKGLTAVVFSPGIWILIVLFAGKILYI